MKPLKTRPSINQNFPQTKPDIASCIIFESLVINLCKLDTPQYWSFTLNEWMFNIIPACWVSGVISSWGEIHSFIQGKKSSIEGCPV